VLDLIRTSPDVRFVFKEMPIFGPTSEHAARAAVAVKKAGGDYLGLYAAFMAARPLDDEAIDRIARQKGAHAADLTGAGAAAATAPLARTAALFSKLALGGTPAFIVGDQIILGEDMDGVATAVARARARHG
jgi:protein-disulfide isomerase